MIILKNWQLLTLLMLNTITINACSNSNADNKLESINTKVEQKTEISQQPVQKEISKLQEDLDKAKKSGKAVFIVVTGTGVTESDKAFEIAKDATKIYKNAVVLTMNRDNVENAQLVAEWRLSGAPLPLILVLSPKGFPTGGYALAQATAENIAAFVPSQNLEFVYESIKNEKHAIVVFSKKSFIDRKEVIKISKEAVSMLNNEAVFVEVDMDDPLEGGFLNQLRIDKSKVNASITLVINKQGQVAGTSTSIPDAEKLVAAAKTPVKSGCGPGCGPSGCGK